jgi:ribonucleoside-triphosphate reductase
MLAPGKHPIKFYLKKEFKEQLKATPINWAYGGLSEFTFFRTYSRKKENGTLETWHDCVIRVIEGMFSILKTHCIVSHLPWDEKKGHKLAEEAALRLFEFKWTPPGRGLWMMGTDFIWERGAAALNNCAFVSTENIDAEMSKPFAFLMDMSMLGVGVGFDTKGADKVLINKPLGVPEIILVEDSREGWVEAISCLIDSYMEEGSTPVDIDCRLVRKYGERINGFGGVASGPEPLIQGFYGIRDILNNLEGQLITSVAITDIMNIIGKIVVAGNVRRTAEIAFSEPEDTDFMEMKNWEKFGVETGAAAPYELNNIDPKLRDEYNTNPDSRKKIAEQFRNEPWAYKFGGWRWASNNSIFGRVGMDYTAIAKNIATNGEPGLAWLENMQKFGRMKDGENNKDYRVRGGNPCLEQSLEPYELCCLVETYPAKHKDYWDFQRSLKFAYLYAKTVTLMATHWPETNSVMTRNRRIGCSQSGIMEAINKFGRRKYFSEFCDDGYTYVEKVDKKYAEWLGIPSSIKKTSVKPSGTVSLVAGAWPGIHYAESDAYYRTVRIAAIDPIVQLLKESNYRVEPSVTDPYKTVVVYFPVLHDLNTIPKDKVSIWEQFKNAADMQYYWADNQVSITVTFKPSEADQIARCLSAFDNQLKGISLLPLEDHGYAQAPYIPADRREILAYQSELLPLNFSKLTQEGANAEANKFCDSTGCEI